MPGADERLVQEVRRQHAEGVAEHQEQDADVEEVAAPAQRYCTQHPAAVPFGRERSLAALGEHVAVNGRIDRLDEAADPAEPGELIVIDYKTGRRVPTDDDARVSRALAVYAVIVQRSLRRPAFVVQLHHVPSGVIATHRHTPQSLERQFARVESIGRDIAAAQESGRDADFPPSPRPRCALDRKSVV